MTEKRTKILLIEDNPGDVRLIQEMLAEAPQVPYKLECADRLSTGLERLGKATANLVLLDLGLPDSQGLDTLDKVQAREPAAPILVLTALHDSLIGIQAVGKGAQDYLIKGRVQAEELWRAMRYAMERKRNEQQLKDMATHDALTGLPNRRLFNDRLDIALAQAGRTRQPLIVIMLDLDGFKQVNDTMGHSVGDELLKAVGRRLTGLLRKSDTIARMGGDEFMLLLPQVTRAEDAAAVAQKIVGVVGKRFVLDSHELNVTTSVGVSIYPTDGEDANTLTKNADAAMRSAKQQGRNNYQFYTAEQGC